MSAENVRVAVRVRPFSEREKQRRAQLIVAMEGKSTILVDPDNPKNQPRTFNFDHSYWSHDGYTVREDGYCEPDNAKYVDQLRVFNELGRGMVDNAVKGYNCSIFAYGQTGSGKSYSIMGHGANQGLVPRVCEDLFAAIEKNKQGDIQTEVTFSMLEIYNEQVRDLLNKKKTPPGGLKIKESPAKGFYVEGLSVVPVGNYNDIRLRIGEGNRQRTIAATKMNETSSRAHTIITVKVAQNSRKNKVTKLSSINLVDLAGSERAKQTEATGDRFEEAKNINKSLLTLGNVIKGLCDQAKGHKGPVPYRDSILTKLLKVALGGNSKTIMVAAISPDAENYEQTLSTLRYADRAKAIKQVAKVNETATDKMIKELIAEKERLLNELKNAKANEKTGITEEEIQRMKEEQEREIQRYREQMIDTEKAWQKRLEEARREMEEEAAREKKAQEEEKKTPHLSNLNEDPALAGKILHLLKTKTVIIGNGKDDSNPDVVMNGPKITREHAEVSVRQGEVYLKPLQGLVLHNGEELTKEVRLSHQDRLRFGSNNLFVFIHPKEAEDLLKKGRKPMEITFEYAQSEIAKHSGLDIDHEDSILQTEVMSMMQLVQDVNAMAEEMDKPVQFNIILVSPEARGLETGRTEVFVRVVDTETDNEYLWERNKFLNRQCHMQEMYQTYEESGQLPDVDKEKDPFWEPYNTPVIIGVALAPLNYLAHMVEFEGEPLTVIDYRAKQAGFLKVELMPTDAKGREDVNLMVEDPIDLVGKQICFKVKIHQSMNLPSRFVQTWCRYRFHLDSEYSTTKKVQGMNPKYNYERLFKFARDHVTHKFVDHLKDSSLAIEVWGEQGSKPSSSSGNRRKEDRQKLQSDIAHWKGKAQMYKNLLEEVYEIACKGESPELVKIKKLIEEAK